MASGPSFKSHHCSQKWTALQNSFLSVMRTAGGVDAVPAEEVPHYQPVLEEENIHAPLTAPRIVLIRVWGGRKGKESNDKHEAQHITSPILSREQTFRPP